MPGTQYDVGARLRISGLGQSNAGVNSLANRLTTVGARVRGAGTGFGSLARQIAGLAGAYVGFRALQSGLGGLVRSAVSFNRELERTKIGLQAVLGATSEGAMSFEQAGATANRVFRELSDDAIRSVATTRELFSIYQGIVGPIRAAGFELREVRFLTAATVSAASALNVDFPQAARDINLMVRGVAGMDVRLFSILRSTGAISETTEEWNKNLTAQQRVERLRTALSRFTPAAEAYGRTWAGLTSSLRDLFEQFLGALSSPAMASVQRFMGQWVDRMVQQRGRIRSTLISVGEDFASRLDAMFFRVDRGLTFVVENWDSIVERGRSFANQIRQMLPQIRQIAQMFIAFQVGRQVVGGGLQVAGAAMGGLNVAAGITSAFTGGGAAAATAGAGGTAAAATGLEGILAAATAVSTVLGPIVAIFGAFAAVGLVVYELWDRITGAFQIASPLFAAIWEDLTVIASGLWAFIRPLAMLIGANLLVGFVVSLTALLVVLRVVINLIRVFVEAIAPIGRAFSEYIVDPIVAGIGRIITVVADLLARLDLGSTTGVTGLQRLGAPEDLRERDPLGALAASMASGEREFGSIPGVGAATAGGVRQRPVVHNDFRGSRIRVQQDFREADPDRVLLRFTQDITRQAESRVQSGYANAFSR